MQSEVPSQSFIWGVLAPRFQSELTLQKSEIWRLAGFLEEYGGAADGDRDRELEQKALIAELTGLLVQAVNHEVADQQFTGNSSRRPGRPPDVVIPYLAPELLSVFLRCHDKAGRQSVVTSIDGELKQKEAGPLFDFINALIQPLNQYLTTELHCFPLSAERLARFALDKRREEKQREAEDAAKKAAKKAAAVMMREAAKSPS
jgi:hypothetical protein